MEMNPTALERIRVASRPEIARLSVTQFHRMIELGILAEGEPIELIDGILVRKDNSDAGGDPMAHGPKHAFCVQRLKDLEGRVKPYRCHLRQQLPITLSDNREPEPDIALVRGIIDDYSDHHPDASDCLTIIEVADSSLDYDRTTKARIYAAVEIPFYWIVNIPERQIEVYESPVASEERYAKQTILKSGATVKWLLEPDISIDVEVDAILP
jgi:Uma2 family endonuclease